MGLYRIALALAVFASHCGIIIAGQNQGIIAVISFFLVSGYVMTLVINKYYSDPRNIVFFYLDRLARLLPQFLVWVALSLIVYSQGLLQSPFIVKCTAGSVLENLLMVPMDIWAGAGPQTEPCMLAPQTWSLGLEFCFYAAVPFVLLFTNVPARVIIFLTSFAIFCLAYLGAIDTNAWGYRYLPGTFFIFMTGISLADREHLPEGLISATWTACVSLFLFCFVYPRIGSLPYNVAVLSGIIIGTPSVYVISSRIWGTWDKWFGDLAYGIFLNHFLLIGLATHFFGIPETEAGRVSLWLGLMPVSAACAYVSFRYVERAALSWRRTIRRRANMGREVIAVSASA